MRGRRRCRGYVGLGISPDSSHPKIMISPEGLIGRSSDVEEQPNLTTYRHNGENQPVQ